jgi:hypothetical protein
VAIAGLQLADPPHVLARLLLQRLPGHSACRQVNSCRSGCFLSSRDLPTALSLRRLCPHLHMLGERLSLGALLLLLLLQPAITVQPYQSPAILYVQVREKARVCVPFDEVLPLRGHAAHLHLEHRHTLIRSASTPMLYFNICACLHNASCRSLCSSAIRYYPAASLGVLMLLLSYARRVSYRCRSLLTLFCSSFCCLSDSSSASALRSAVCQHDISSSTSHSLQGYVTPFPQSQGCGRMKRQPTHLVVCLLPPLLLHQ